MPLYYAKSEKFKYTHGKHDRHLYKLTHHNIQIKKKKKVIPLVKVVTSIDGI